MWVVKNLFPPQIRCFCDILRIRWESARSRTRERALMMMDKLVWGASLLPGLLDLLKDIQLFWLYVLFPYFCYMFSNTLYRWTAAYLSPVVISYLDFLVLFAPNAFNYISITYINLFFQLNAFSFPFLTVVIPLNLWVCCASLHFLGWGKYWRPTPRCKRVQVHIFVELYAYTLCLAMFELKIYPLQPTWCYLS